MKRNESGNTSRGPWKLVAALSLALACTPLLKVAGNRHACALKNPPVCGSAAWEGSREENLVRLLEAYRERRGEYPESLWQLHRSSCSWWPLPEDLGLSYVRGASGYELKGPRSIAQK